MPGQGQTATQREFVRCPAASLPAIFVFFVRLSDYVADSTDRLSFPTRPDEELSLQYSLSHDDMQELQRLLVRVNVAASESEAAAKIGAMPTTNRTFSDVIELRFLPLHPFA